MYDEITDVGNYWRIGRGGSLLFPAPISREMARKGKTVRADGQML